VALMGLLASVPASAGPPAATVIERVGMLCPPSYLASGDYCVPGYNARHAIRRISLCPPGYLAYSDYCLAGPTARHTLPRRSGICPPGYARWGDYCVSRPGNH